MTIKTPKKLIEVALPLDKINEAAAREKSIRHGHPSTLHLWWARRPLAAARAVIFAQMVNDPGFQQGGGFRYGMNKAEAAKERQRLFRIMEKLVLWENTTNEDVLEEARTEIRRSWREVCELNKDQSQAAELFNPDQLPAFHDPFAGGGALPLEAQRLGLTAYASDLNPVAVTINKAMIEIPPKFAGRAPVGPLPKGEKKMVGRTWPGATGLAEDVRRYGAWMREEAETRIGHLYPPVEITEAMAQDRPDLKPLIGHKLTVIAWIWARTVKSPNPAFNHVRVPLASTFVLSSKAGKEAYVQPVVEGDQYRFEVKVGTPSDGLKAGTTAGKRNAFICLLSKVPVDYNFIRAEGKAGRMGQKLMAIVAEGVRGRVYLSPTKEIEDIAAQAEPTWKPTTVLPDNPRDFKTPNYGMASFGDLFTPPNSVGPDHLFPIWCRSPVPRSWPMPSKLMALRRSRAEQVEPGLVHTLMRGSVFLGSFLTTKQTIQHNFWME
jgi:putative DNA methylase